MFHVERLGSISFVWLYHHILLVILIWFGFHIYVDVVEKFISLTHLDPQINNGLFGFI
jgi:hypothetical protein